MLLLLLIFVFMIVFSFLTIASTVTVIITCISNVLSTTLLALSYSCPVNAFFVIADVGYEQRIGDPCI